LIITEPEEKVKGAKRSLAQFFGERSEWAAFGFGGSKKKAL